ncbi:hypothetical protein Tco_1227343, partial [Tanacetum coccineum]
STSPIPISIPSAGKEDKRKGKEIMTEPEKPAKAKVQEQMNSNVMINKHMAEYEEAENDLTIEEKTELITELINYQKDFARIKKYQAQQQRLASKSERRKFYTSVLRSHAGWKTKDLRVMTFDQLEEKFIPVWESIQDFVPMDSKKERESLKRPGILLEKVKAKRLKTSDVSAQEQQESDNQDAIINLQQWAMLVREETSVNITPSVVYPYSVENADLKAQIQEKVFANASLKNELGKLKGNIVDSKFAKASILGNPPLQPSRNHLVVRQPNAFTFERPRMSRPRFASQVDEKNDLSKTVTPHYLPKVRESAAAKPHQVNAPNYSRNSHKESYGSNDMVHAYFLEDARKMTQDKTRIPNHRDMASTRAHYTPNACTPKPRNIY